MSLTAEQKKRYRTIGHQLNPLVTIAGNGLTDNIYKEIDRALSDHELIKVKFVVSDRDIKKQAMEEVAQNLSAEIVQTIGHVAVLLRVNPQANPKLSNIARYSAL